MHDIQQIPSSLAQLLGRLPAYPGSVLFAASLNVSLLPHMPLDVLTLLQGRVLRIQSRDAGLAFDFVYRAGRFHGVAPGGAIDLTITAGVRDFYLLARRKEDPDTLFFSRRLTMEGDTELGLIVKNTLDSLDLAQLDPAQMIRKSVWEFLRSGPLSRRRANRLLE